MLIPFSASLLALPGIVQAQHSHAMALECRGASANTAESRRRAEQWVQTRLPAFVPTPDQALRMQGLALQVQQVLLAFGSISSTCEQYLAGRIEGDVADRALSGFEQTIANFLHDVGNDAVVTASRGQVSDMPAIKKSLTDIGTTGRQAAMFGDDAMAEEARKKLVNALVTFSRTFVEEACYNQTFDPRIAMGLHRQNEILGTGIDVTPCAKRKFTAEGRGGDIVWHFAHCGQGIGEWKVKTEGPLQGAGLGTVDNTLKGEWNVDEDTPEADVRVQYQGDMEIVTKAVDGEPDLVQPDQLKVHATQGTVTAEDITMTRALNISGMSFAVKKSDKPCRSADDER